MRVHKKRGIHFNEVWLYGVMSHQLRLWGCFASPPDDFTMSFMINVQFRFRLCYPKVIFGLLHRPFLFLYYYHHLTLEFYLTGPYIGGSIIFIK